MDICHLEHYKFIETAMAAIFNLTFFLDLIAFQFQYLKYIGTQGNYVVASDIAPCCLSWCGEMSQASGLLAQTAVKAQQAEFSAL